MSIDNQLSADPLLSHTSMANYCNSLMSYAKDYHQQVKETFLNPTSKDPFGHSPEPGDWVFWKCHQRKTAHELHWDGPYKVLPTTDTAAKLEGIEPCVHISQLKNSPTGI